MTTEWSAERLAARPRAVRVQEIEALGESDAAELEADWAFWARPDQCAPEGDWRVWLLMAGRGFGKTRAGAEWVRGLAERDGRARIALVGATMGEARRVMVEGDSGVLAIAHPDRRPKWEASLGRITWATGAVATLYGAAEPEALRGPQFSHAWADEIAKWPRGEAAWDNLMLALRIGYRPRMVWAMVSAADFLTTAEKRTMLGFPAEAAA